MSKVPLSLAIVGVLLLLSSCFKEDEQITPQPRGDVKTDTIALTENYQYQVYFGLDSAMVVSTNKKTGFDLGFECAADGSRILLNTSNFMTAADLGAVAFGIPYDTTGYKQKFDKSDGNPDSTAIGHWFEIAGNDTIFNLQVYAVNAGIDELGNPLGLYQVIFDSLKGNAYYFRYAPLSGGMVQSGVVHKNNTVGYIWFSLAEGQVKSIEPDKDRFDLLFTQYTTLLYTDAGDPYPYLVTGVLSNRNGVRVAKDTLGRFTTMTRDIAIGLTYSDALDAVGYEWKYYNFDSGAYTIEPGISYIVHTKSGFYFKLRFIGFYNRNGSKGYPVIEYQLL